MTNTTTLETISGVSTRKVVANILATYAKATEANKIDGAQWYPEAHLTAVNFSANYAVSVECAVAVIAHMSPRLHWGRNVEGAGMVLATKANPLTYNPETDKFEETVKGFLGNSLKNARKAMASNDPISTLNGSKVKAFAANILGDNNAVTIDVWAMRLAFGDVEINDKWLQRKGFYDEVAKCYRIAAKRIGIDPAVLQAITWIVVRNGRKN